MSAPEASGLRKEQLPQINYNPDKVTTTDMWGFAESQETSSVSPEMYEEFIYPYHKKILDRFGLNCYGCCEPYDLRWKIIKKLPRLRRVSISPWANLSSLEENLGKNYIASIKPNPAYLAQSTMDEAAVRENISCSLKTSKNCIPEIIMKDNHTLGGNPQNAIKWVEIAREEIVRNSEL